MNLKNVSVIIFFFTLSFSFSVSHMYVAILWDVRVLSKTKRKEGEKIKGDNRHVGEGVGEDG